MADKDRERSYYALDVGGSSYELDDIRGVEALSHPYRFEGIARDVTSLVIDPEGQVGRRCFLSIVENGELIRRIQGVLTDVSFTQNAKADPEFTFVLEPAFATLRYKFDNRVFVDMTIPDIVAEVLSGGGIIYDKRLQGSYPKRPYTVQYQESDFNFVTRLLEQEGIFYFFADDGEHTMILGDNPGSYEDRSKDVVLPLNPSAGQNADIEHLFQFGMQSKLVADKVTLRDFNPEKPSLNMDVSAPGPRSGPIEYYDYPGKYRAPAEGQRFADFMAQALACEADGFHGAGNTKRLAHGAIVTFEDLPSGAPNGPHVITEVEHAWEGGNDVIWLAFKSMKASETYRPFPATPRPVISNPLTGVVTGPPGEDIFTDEYGRVKVKFPWNRRVVADPDCSLWIPVLQDNTGHSLGIPRIGWEVMVGFIEGDPDRPVVMGRTYNTKYPFPELLPKNKTRSALKSLTSPTRAGMNEIRLEDLAADEQILIHAEKDQNVKIDHDKTEDVLNNEINTVQGTEDIEIGNNHTGEVGVDRELRVEADQTLTVMGNRTRKVAGQDKHDIGANQAITIGGNHSRKIDASDVVRPKSLSETVGAVDLEASLKANTVTTDGAMMLTVGGAHIEVTAMNKAETTKMFRAETVGGLVFTGTTAAVGITSDTRTTTIGGMLKANAPAISIKGTTGLTAKALKGVIEGTGSLSLRVGKSEVVLTGNDISINSDGSIEIKAKGPGKLEANKANLNM